MGLNIVKIEPCPVCGSTNVHSDKNNPTLKKICYTCGSEWVLHKGIKKITFNSREFQKNYDDETERIWNDYREEYECPECGSTDIDNWDNPNEPITNQASQCNACGYVGPREEFGGIMNEGLHLPKQKSLIHGYTRRGLLDLFFELGHDISKYDSMSDDELVDIYKNLEDEFKELICPDCGSPDVTMVGYNYDTGHIDYECNDCGTEGIESYFRRELMGEYGVGREEELNEQNCMNTGKLKLMEILTQADITQIKALAALEANKVKADLKPEIKGVKDKAIAIEKDLAKHLQDQALHLKNQDVKDIVKSAIDKVQDQQTKTDDKIAKMEKTIDDKIEKMTNSKDLEKKMKEMVADVMAKYHQTLWVKRGFWTNGITK